MFSAFSQREKRQKAKWTKYNQGQKHVWSEKKNTQENPVTQGNQRADNSEATMLRLSDDIGKMADRIGEMADRIGEMADRIGEMSERILETQKIQGKNLELMQKTVNDAMIMMGTQAETSNKMLELLVQKSNQVDKTLTAR